MAGFDANSLHSFARKWLNRYRAHIRHIWWFLVCRQNICSEYPKLQAHQQRACAFGHLLVLKLATSGSNVFLLSCFLAMCSFIFFIRLNLYPQTWHSTGFIPSWTSEMYWFILCFQLNFRAQNSHWNGFLPSCTSAMWRFNLIIKVNFLLQTLHFFSSCTLSTLHCSLEFAVNGLSETSHSNILLLRLHKLENENC